jgi:hypothetical protein
MRWSLLGVGVLAVAGVGCSSAAHRNARLLQKQAAFDFNCPAKQIQVTPLGGRNERQFIAQGCGRRATYQDMGAGPVLASPIEGQPGLPPLPTGAVPPPPPSPPPAM